MTPMILLKLFEPPSHSLSFLGHLPFACFPPPTIHLQVTLMYRLGLATCRCSVNAIAHVAKDLRSIFLRFSWFIVLSLSHDCYFYLEVHERIWKNSRWAPATGYTPLYSGSSHVLKIHQRGAYGTSGAYLSPRVPRESIQALDIKTLEEFLQEITFCPPQASWSLTSKSSLLASSCTLTALLEILSTAVLP